ncbi:calcium/sodium antiporter [Almyronema epifaneia]|uniref:Calcium/sodium antiporter n=1 Tax=Almyronema epifaneia S1 TaxID=2991925 RepID=A0ABW6IHP7_9CYAN
MSFTDIFILLVGLVLLVAGAELLVKGASRLAASVGIPPLIVGLTIVAYGTSAPELAVSIQSGLSQQAEIALGNIVGSNILNVLLILGISALISPLIVSQQLVRLDVPIMVGVSFLTLLFSLDGLINSSDGLVLVLGGICYTLFLIIQGRKEKDVAVQAEYQKEYGSRDQTTLKTWLVNLGFIAIGLVLLVGGSRLLINGAIAIAEAFQASQLVIGLTIVATGTSLPELATSAIASLRGERDIAVGNVVGSNIFNILLVLGVAGVITPTGIDVNLSALRFDIPVMIAVAIACLPIFATGNIVSRWEGGLFLGYYVAYTTYLILDAAKHENIEAFNSVLLLVVMPLTVLMLLIASWRASKRLRH